MTKFYTKSDIAWLPNKQLRLPTTGEVVSYVSPSSELKRVADNSWKEKWQQKVGVETAKKVSQKAKQTGTHTHTQIETSKEAKLAEWEQAYSVVTREVFCWHKLSDGRYLIGFADAVVSEIDNPDNHYVVDFKTASKPKKLEWISDYMQQVSVYAPMLANAYGFKFTGAQIVILIHSEDKPQVFTLDRQTIKLNFKLFQKRTNIRLAL